MMKLNSRQILFFIQAFWLVTLPTSSNLLAGRPVEKTHFTNHQTIRVWIYLRSDQEYSQYFKALEYPEKTYQRLAKGRIPAKPSDDDFIPNDDLLSVIALNVDHLRHYSRFLHAFSAEIDITNLERLSALPIVEKIELVECNVSTRPDLLKAEESSKIKSGKATATAYEAQLEQLNIPAAHALGLTGDGVRIGLIDTGFFKDHEVFSDIISSGRLIAEYDFINDDTNVDDETADDSSRGQNNHGTAVWSLVGGYSPPTYLGAAYGSEFLLAKTEREGTEIHREEDDFVAAVEWCDYWGADIVSVSLGYRDFTGGFEYDWSVLDGKTAITTRAVNWAFERGILVVCCAGNDAIYFDDGGLLTPGDAFGALTVGAVDAQGTIADFSSHGPTCDGRIKPDLCAMGVAAYYAWCSPGAYRTGNGTSLATPLVAGAAALLLESHPELTPSEIMTELKRYANRARNPNHNYGWGIPDVYRSIVNYEPSGFPITEITARQILAYPNPAVSAINFYFIWHKATPSASSARLQVFNLDGQMVFEKKLDGDFGGKKEILAWDLFNKYGAKAATGIYFVRLKSADYLKTGKFLIMH